MAFQISRHMLRPAFFMLATACLTVPAQAGFEWTPPPAPMVNNPAPAPAQKAAVPAAAPVTHVEGAMLPMPGDEAAPSPQQPVTATPAPAPRASALPPPVVPLRSPETIQPPAATAPPQPVIKTISMQQPPSLPTAAPQAQPRIELQPDEPPVVMQAPQPEPLPEPYVRMPEPVPVPAPAPAPVIAAPVEPPPIQHIESPAPAVTNENSYVAKDSVTKRKRYSEWLTEAQAQEMSMQIHNQDAVQEDSLEQQGALMPVTETPQVPAPPPVESVELSPPQSPQDDVMQLLSPDDLMGDMTSPAPPQETAYAPPPEKVVMPDDAPEKAKTAPVKKPAPKKSKPPTPPKEVKAKQEPKAETPKAENVLEKIPDEPAPVAEKSEPAFTGFGNDIPLAFAMEQILPEGYSFDFADGVNAEERVSWKGGKPWKDVIDGILANQGLTSRMDGKTLYITKKS